MPDTTPILRCLTVDAHWAWAIAQGIKRVENRTRGIKTSAGQPIAHETYQRGHWALDVPFFLAIHAGLRLDMAEAQRRRIIPDNRGLATSLAEMEDGRGKILAVVQVPTWFDQRQLRPAVIDTVRVNFHGFLDDSGRWPIGLLLDEVSILPCPVACKGKQGLWTLRPEDAAAVVGQLPEGHVLLPQRPKEQGR